MKLSEFTGDMEVIQKLATFPNADDGLTAEQLKAKFDQAPAALKEYINNTLVPAVRKLQSKGGSLVVTVADGVADKSLAEILAAAEEQRHVVLLFGGMRMGLLNINNARAVFTTVLQDGRMTANAVMASDGTVTVQSFSLASQSDVSKVAKTYTVLVFPGGDGYTTDDGIDDILAACESSATVVCDVELDGEHAYLRLPLVKYNATAAYFGAVFDGKEYLVTITADGVTLEVLESAGQPGKDGADGKDGEDYVLTNEDKQEIAEMAAELVDVPDSGGNVDLTGYATEEFVKNKIEEAELGGEEVDLSGYAQKSELPTKVSELENDAGYLTEHQDISGKADQTEVDSLASNQSALSARMDSFTKLGEGSTTGDAELMDARVDCEGNIWKNAGGHIRGITEKIIDACCDKEVIEGGNYNLLKPSECTYSSRLQNDVEEIVSSTNNNLVTGWFPVTYGKYYCVSCYASDLGTRTHLRGAFTRIQLKLADGTIKLYALGAYPEISVSNGPVYGVDDENAVYMRGQIQLKANSSSSTADISTSDKLKALEPMIVEGNTAEEAHSNSVNFAYLDGDVEIPGEVNYKPKLEKRLEMLENWDKHLVYEAQKRVSYDWRIPFIDVFNKVGLGSKHIIPGTYDVWGGTGNDLTQKEIMMEDGIHPNTGNGVTKMYAQAIIPQLKAIPPLYSADSQHEDWNGKTMLWMGSSIPAGSDADGATYPAITASKLGATCTNIARGSSCVRINSSAGNYENMAYTHFLRSLSRTTAEADLAQANWDNIKVNITSAASTISASDLAIMKEHSFESLLLPYLNGTHPMPDLFVIDHGHNDRRPVGVDGKQDLLVKPTLENIASGVLAEDTYMTDNNYANLKTAFNDDLSKIGDIESFAASLNRNCFVGAVNFIITLIYRYNPKARIVIISDYD